MCTTAKGYTERIMSKVEAVKMLRDPNIWTETSAADEDAEDARDVLEVIKRLCKMTGKKGKHRHE